MILLAAGRDCTDLFESYHPFSSSAHKTIEAFYIGELDGPPEVAQFQPDSGFYRDLKTAVGAHFAQTRLNPKAATGGAVRLAAIFACAALTFVAAHTLKLPLYARVTAAALFGICQALPLLHVMHDCSHAAFSNSPGVWSFFGRLCMDFFAGARYSPEYSRQDCSSSAIVSLFSQPCLGIFIFILSTSSFLGVLSCRAASTRGTTSTRWVITSLPM
jgi:hypothetical protein